VYGPRRAAPEERRCTIVIVLVIVLVVAAFVLVVLDARFGSRRSSKAATERSAKSGPGRSRGARGDNTR